MNIIHADAPYVETAFYAKIFFFIFLRSWLECRDAKQSLKMQPKPHKSVDHSVLNKLAKAMSSIKNSHQKGWQIPQPQSK